MFISLNFCIKSKSLNRHLHIVTYTYFILKWLIKFSFIYNLIKIFSFTIFMSSGEGTKRQQLLICKFSVCNLLRNFTFLNILSVYLFIFFGHHCIVWEIKLWIDQHFIRISQGVSYHLNLYVQQVIDIDDYIMREKGISFTSYLKQYSGDQYISVKYKKDNFWLTRNVEDYWGSSNSSGRQFLFSPWRRRTRIPNDI